MLDQTRDYGRGPTRITDDDDVYINQSRARVSGAPCYAPGLADQDYCRNLYG